MWVKELNNGYDHLEGQVVQIREHTEYIRSTTIKAHNPSYDTRK